MVEREGVEREEGGGEEGDNPKMARALACVCAGMCLRLWAWVGMHACLCVRTCMLVFVCLHMCV